MDYKPNATKRHATAQKAHAPGEQNALDAARATAQTAAIITARITAAPATKAVS